MPSRTGGRKLGARSKLIMALLLAMAALTGVLTYQAQDAARSHRATAERALKSYAAIAAWNLDRSARQVLFDELGVRMDAVRAALPAPERLLQVARSGQAASCGCLSSRPGYVNFALVGPERLLVSDSRLSPALQGWIRDSLASRPTAPITRAAGMGLAFPDEERTIVFVHRARPDGMVYDYGYMAARGTLAPLFAGILKVFPLLPKEQLGGSANEDLLSAEVFTPAGTPIYRSPRLFSRNFSVSEPLPAVFGSMRVTVALQPDAADRLVIGGLPRSRLPLLIGLLLLTLALVGVAVQQLRREAELIRMREDFVSSVSHELRTPLAQIRMFAETLLLGRTRSEAERRRSLEIIDQEARRLTHLVENVLRMSRSARGVSQVAPVAVDLSGDVAAIAESFRMFTGPRKVELRLELQERVRCLVDRDGLRQMVLNLLDNALKYGPAGQTIVLGLALIGDSARIWVDDEGPGIAPEDLEKVFSPFYRSSRDVQSRVAGSGIGLAVVREIATSHGGRAWAEAAPAGGARVTIELPEAHVGAPSPEGEWVAA